MKKYIFLVLLLTIFSCSRTLEYNDLESIKGTFGYLEDGKNVYYTDSICAGMGCTPYFEKIDADLKSFTNIENSYYVKDKNNVYYKGEKIIDLDVESFTILSSYSIKDEDGVYNGSKKIILLDPSSVKIIGEYYFIDKNNVFYCIPSGSCNILKGADSASFEELPGFIVKDKNNEYKRGEIVVNMNSEGFIELGNKYLKKNNSIFYGNKILEGVDYKTFKVFSESHYARDKNNIYYDGIKITGLKNISSIEVVGDGNNSTYLKDDENIYYFSSLFGYEANILKGVDYNTFVYDVGSMGHDKNNKFHMGK